MKVRYTAEAFADRYSAAGDRFLGGGLFLADAVLKSRPKPKPSGPIHPFAEEEMWGGRPKK